MEKRGQFYLIAALAIVAVIASLSLIYNAARAPEEDRSLSLLSEEISYEIGRAVDSGVQNSLVNEDINDNIEILTDYYAEANPETDFLVIYADRTDITFIAYNNPQTSNIGVLYEGEEIISAESEDERTSQTRLRQGSEGTIVLIDGKTYDFQLRPGRAFFILIKKEKGGERFIASN